MINQSQTPEAENHKTIVLQKFLMQFLPQSGNKRKYAHNEFSYLFKTLQKIFSQYYKTELSESEVLTCLSQSGYSLYVTSDKVGNNKKESPVPKKNKPESFVSEEISACIYINISSGSVYQLRNASLSLALQKNSAKLEELIALREKITLFITTAAPG